MPLNVGCPNGQCSAGSGHGVSRQAAKAPGSAGGPGSRGNSPSGGGQVGKTGNGDLSKYEGMIQAAAKKHGLDGDFIKAVMKQESGGKVDAKSTAGASGLMQLMPATAKSLGVTDINDPEQNINAGAKYLKAMLDKADGNVKQALVGYNAGPGRMNKGNLPAETQKYTQTILSKYNGKGYANGGGQQAGGPTPR